MFSTILLTIALAGTAASVASGSPSWEVVFQAEKGPDGWVSAVVAWLATTSSSLGDGA